MKSGRRIRLQFSIIACPPTGAGKVERLHLRPFLLCSQGTGIWLNNSLACSAFEPAGNPMDAHPGRRKLSGDCPTIIFKDGRPWAALGTPGGHSIGQTVPQMVMYLVDFGMDIGAALAGPAPRRVRSPGGRTGRRILKRRRRPGLANGAPVELIEL